MKQASKLNFYRKENEQLKEQIQILNTNLKLNKQIMAVTVQNTSDMNLEESVQAQLKAYQQREEASEKQIEDLLKQREENQAQILVNEQMMADFKQNEGDHIKELEYEIDELKAKLDKTEYIIQYKEKIWTYLEREIRKVVSADSELMRKIEEQTKILPDCLAQQKVSNVVK